MAKKEPASQNPLAELIRARRLDKGLTQQELAERVGISKAAVSALENGKNSPKLETYKLLDKELNLAPETRPRYIKSMVPFQGSSTFKVETIDAYVIPYLQGLARNEMVETGSNGHIGLTELYRGLRTYPIGAPHFLEEEHYRQSLIVEIIGEDAMQPRLNGGSKILVQPLVKEEWLHASPGIYAILTTSRFMVKRIKDTVAQGGSELTFHADNSIAEPVTVKATDIIALWRAERIVDGPIN